jgi:hypothetical protein
MLRPVQAQGMQRRFDEIHLNIANRNICCCTIRAVLQFSTDNSAGSDPKHSTYFALKNIGRSEKNVFYVVFFAEFL